MPKAVAIDKTPCLCIRMRRASQKMTDFYGRMLASVGLTLNQFSLLVNISRMEGCGTGELARKVGQDKSTLVRTLEPLMREGLIVDRAPENERKRQLHVTQQGRAVLNQATPMWAEAQTRLAAKLGKSHAELMAFFDRLDELD